MTEMKDTDSNILARIDERTQAQGITLTAHVKEDADKFEKVFSFVSKRFDAIDSKLDDLYADKNRRQGALMLGRIICGGIGGVIAIVAEYLLPFKH